MQHVKSLLCSMLCIFWIGAASAQSFWEYSAQGSLLRPQGEISNISGSLFLDGTVRAWNEPNLPSVPSNGTHTFLISSFDLDIGNLDFFGGGPFSNPGNTNAVYMGIGDNPRGSGENFGYFAEWFLRGSGDFTGAAGDARFFNSDGSEASVLDIFQAPPALVHTTGTFCGADCFVQMDWTRVAQVAPMPEPEIYAMLGVGLAMLGWVARRKKLNTMAKN